MANMAGGATENPKANAKVLGKHGLRAPGSEPMAINRYCVRSRVQSICLTCGILRIIGTQNQQLACY